MGRLKRIVLWGLGLLLSSAVFIAALLWIAGDGILRWAAQDLLESSIERKVHIDGTFSVDFGWDPGLIVTDVWIENPPWAAKKEMARIQRTEVQLALKTLLSGTVHLPRLILEGVTIDLETNPDGQVNWDILKAGNDRARSREKKRVFPVLETVTLKDVRLTHADRRRGRTTEIILAQLARKEGHDVHESHEIYGEGSFNKTPFQINGRFGSIDDALAATMPYPMEMTLEAVGLVAELKGTVRDLPKGEGFDLSLTVEAPSIGQVLRILQSDLGLEGRAEASAHLKGSLETLGVENLVVQVDGAAKQTLRAEGTLENLWTGEGLDLRLTGSLGPQALSLPDDLSGALGDILSGVTQTDIDGRITGGLRALVFEQMKVHLSHGSGADLSLDGHGALELARGRAALTGLDVTGALTLPDPTLLEQALESDLPDLGAIQATVELSWAEGGLTIRSFTAKAESFGSLQLDGKGRIGGITGEALSFEFDPQLDLSASIESTQPLAALFGQPAKPSQAPSGGAESDLILLVQQGLLSLGSDPGPADGKLGPKTRAAIEAYQAKNGLSVDGQVTEHLLARIHGDLKIDPRRTPSASGDGRSGPSNFEEILPALGPVKAAARLSAHEDGYRLDDLKLTLGAKDGLSIEAAGSLETLRFARQDPVAGLALTVDITLPSSKALPGLFPPETPELKNLTGHFDVQGSPKALSISKARFEAEGPDGLSGTATGQIAELTLIPTIATKDLRLELSARSPDSASVLRLFDLRLPELGALQARAALRDRGDLFALSEIDVTVGDETQPIARITGEIADLLAMKQVKLSGRFELPTAQLLAPSEPTDGSALGRLHGEFGLSDSDGTLGLDKLSAALVDTKLLSLSMTGLYGDIAHRDDFHLQTELEVPSVGALGKELGIQAETLGAFSFTGQVSQSGDKILADGKAQLGETEFTGNLSGDLAGERPVFSGKLEAPVFHLGTFGLVPKADDRSASEKQQARNERAATRHRTAYDPIPFDALKAFDLDLEVLFDKLKGVEIDVDTAEVRLDLKDGVLKVDPIRLNFVGGHVKAQLLVDARAATPKVSFSLEADNVDLGKLLSQVRIDVPLDGDMDVVLDLEAEGNSHRALTESLEGEVGLAIARGQILTSMLHLATEDFTSWLFTSSTREGYSDLNCFIARFNIHNGLAKSDQLLLDTTNVRAEGKGKIDLRDETININVDPEPKEADLIDLTTSFKIKGTLADPVVKVGATSTAARAIGEIVLSPILLLGSLLPFADDSDASADHPCLDLAAAAAGE